MRVIIKEEGKRRLIIPLPLGILTTRLFCRLGARALKNQRSSHGEHSAQGLSAEELREFFKALKNTAKAHKRMKLVEVRSSDGSEVDVYF